MSIPSFISVFPLNDKYRLFFHLYIKNIYPNSIYETQKHYRLLKSFYNFYFCSLLYISLFFLSYLYTISYNTNNIKTYFLTTPHQIKGAGWILSSRHTSFTIHRMKTKRKRKRQSQNPSRSPNHSRCPKRVRRRRFPLPPLSRKLSRNSSFLRRSRPDKFPRKRRKRRKLHSARFP